MILDGKGENIEKLIRRDFSDKEKKILQNLNNDYSSTVTNMNDSSSKK